LGINDGGKIMHIEKNLDQQVATFIKGCKLKHLKELTVNDLTRYFDVSKTSLTNLFKQNQGITLGKFILKEKMNRAAFLIERKYGLTIRELAEKTGFCDSDYFIRVFKNHYGLPPGQYRKIRTGR
jgi:two-component system response regulator YesN